ncbi:MAG: hypothetical protein AUJ92_08915 [Armatimonadetes bacterium CG2_30_59_28]|nr:acetyl-CoA carboxylase, biotin carboxyl carrier protein [Armatimonadota bacterium]OIO94895.1 MAG: hypothetical protein AUJ92_08915 [Armatimonadetes bacterium CG2_30_59_28]PIU60738.1 MAG: acetyl-CoA carboxylase, biotin carboxyl carrier protein [Armatimonadetes bacterium CG07_land_8_20_14_0_80_59_28]PIX43383.1 MAG: acetyl-CoA carboxylase, biotin carboxyl carrier protein [Armatimonadetes bacterium CG_4_8_14_3_um_filter_58_9]PIY42143.1 MAG: acetyl-CoA carboxylase, biotin carboxyl carrier protein
MNIDIERVRELIALAKDANITELTVSNETGRITVKKRMGGKETPGANPAGAMQPWEPYPGASASPQSAPSEDSVSAMNPERPLRFVPIRSPIVGTVHLGEKPQADPLVKAGQRVKEGQLVCVVEAMKVLNEVTTPTDGIIAQILVDSDQPAEYGQELMILETEA